MAKSFSSHFSLSLSLTASYIDVMCMHVHAICRSIFIKTYRFI